MLIVRQSQMEIFEEAALRRFESDMLVHLTLSPRRIAGSSANPRFAQGYASASSAPPDMACRTVARCVFSSRFMFMYGCHSTPTAAPLGARCIA